MRIGEAWSKPGAPYLMLLSEPFELNECINVALNVFVILGPRV